MMMSKVLSFLLLTPPGFNILLFVLAYSILWISPRVGRKWMFYSIILFYFFTTPFCVLNLSKFIEKSQPLENFEQKADAIVLLGGGRSNTPEYGEGDMQPNPTSLQRLHYAAYIHRKTHLPIITSGGATETPEETESHLYTRLLKELYNIDNVIQENKSRNTYENAKYVKRLTRKHRIRTVYLVTSAFHMARATYIFEKAGLKVIPASTGYFSKQTVHPQTLFIPSAMAMEQNQLLIGELVGRASYWFKGKIE